MATIDYDGKKAVLVPGQLILDSGMNVFGLHLFMESCEHVPEGIPKVFAFEHRGVRFIVDRDPDTLAQSNESLTVDLSVKD